MHAINPNASDKRGGAMPYHAIWLNDGKIVADEAFTDLLEAQRHVLTHFQDHGEEPGDLSVKVIGNGRTYFFVERCGTTLISSAMME
jgi:hypothetical protein